MIIDNIFLWMSDAETRKRTLSCSTTATAHSTASSYTSYNMDADDADHMIYLESRCWGGKIKCPKVSGYIQHRSLIRDGADI